MKSIKGTLGKYLECSKLLLYFMSLTVWYVSGRTLNFVELAIADGYTGTLAYLTALITAVWGAYGTVLSFYMQKSKSENLQKSASANTGRTI